MILLFLPSVYSLEFSGLYAVIGGAAACLYVRAVKDVGQRSSWFLRVSTLFFLLYASQYFFYSLNGRPVASFIDANISGYYLFLAASYFRAKRSFLLYILLVVLGSIGFSRNFYLAILLLEALLLIGKRLPTSRQLFGNPALTMTLCSLLLVFGVTFIFSQGEFDLEANKGSADRLVEFTDESNANRFLANVHFFDLLLDGEILLVGAGAAKIDDTHRPHNAFFRSVYRYGLLPSVLCFFMFFYVFNRFYAVSAFHKAFLISLFAYYSLLNDFITGSELFLLAVMCHLIKVSMPRSCSSMRQ